VKGVAEPTGPSGASLAASLFLAFTLAPPSTLLTTTSSRARVSRPREGAFHEYYLTRLRRSQLAWRAHLIRYLGMVSEGGQRSDQPGREETKRDPRVQVTAIVWAMLLPVLGMSWLFCTLSRVAILLPFLAIAAAGFGTAAIWAIGSQRVVPDRKENQQLQDRIKELEERLANVETISRFEMQLAAREKAALEDERNQSISQSSQTQSGQKENA